MKAIDFVVRDSAGGLQRGTISGDEKLSVIQAGSGQEISLNLRQIDLQDQQRVDDDLVITLSDGRVITIDGYFNDSGVANRLFISADGYLNEVAFVEADGGNLFAQYGPTEQWGKWSPSDDLIYLGRTELVAGGVADQEVSMFAAPLLGAGILGGGGAAAVAVGGAAVVGGAGLLSGGGDDPAADGGTPGAGDPPDGGGDGDGGGTGGGGGGDQPPATPFVDGPDNTSNIGGDNSDPHVITVSGGGQPGDTVIVTVGGKQIETQIDGNGGFTVNFAGDNFPGDGNHEAEVTVFTTTGQIVLDGPEFIVDTVGPVIEITSGTGSVNDFFNADGFGNGVTMTGNGEPGASISVTVDGSTQTTTVTSEGTWSVAWASGTLQGGEYTTEVRIVSSDSFGNSTTVTDTLVVDTIAPSIEVTGGTGSVNDFFNGETFANGVTLSGKGEPGASMVVTISGVSVSTTVGSDGMWSANWAAGALDAGEYTTGVTMVSTDSFGNSTTVTDTLVVDTIAPNIEVTSGTDSVQDFFNAQSFANGVTLTGKGEPGASLLVTISGVEQTTTVDASGNWSATWASGTLQAGEYSTGVTIVSSDSFGNTTTMTDTLVVDTVTNVSVETDTVEGEGVVNAAERDDGVTLTGTAQPGSTVVVSFGSGTHQASVDANGNWSANFPMSEVPSGETTATVTATATDAFGNTSTSSGQVDIDTLVRDFGFTGSTGGADGVINIAEAASNLVMTGTTEPGSSVVVSMNGASHNAVVSANGTWTVSFSPNEIPTGTTVTTMTAVATDAAGNVDTITRDVAIDRDAGVLTISSTPVEGDDVVNEAEASDGVVLTGTSNANAIVMVTMGGVSHTVQADRGGNWSANFTNSEVAPGVYTAQIHATTTDSAGNTLNATDSVEVDTRVDNLSVHADTVEGDGVINGFERLFDGGVQITGTTEAGSTSVIVNLNGVTTSALVGPNGNWTASFATGQIAEGTYDAPISVTARDRAGNSATITDTVRVDTEVVPLNMTNSGGGTDSTASFAEAATGIDLGGQVEPGSSVIVRFDGTNHTANVDALGNWSVTIPPSSITPGTYDASVVVTATDAVGNVDSLSDTLAIDTQAPEGPVVASYTRDGSGIRGISTDMSDGMLEVHEVHSNGSVTEVNATATDIPQLGETNFQFNSNVPDGSHLVVTSTDDAGNSSGTYLVLDDEAINSQVSLSNPTLGDYNVETADLTFAEEARLTLDEASLLALSENTNELQILGGSDDEVTITGAQKTGSTVRDGERFDIYTLGQEGTVVVDDDINVVI